LYFWVFLQDFVNFKTFLGAKKPVKTSKQGKFVLNIDVLFVL
jgi:hypothetical protein